MSRGKALPCSASFLLFTHLLLFLLLQQYYSSSANQICPPSSCGKISNICHPFRLADDPKHCGNKSYELTCQNNVTVLQLYWGKYYVEAINYHNFTIRLVDPDVQESNCSSIPRYLLYHRNFSDDDPYQHIRYESFNSSYVSMFEYIIYLNCTEAVTDNHIYVDTSPCINEHSNGHIYAIVGRFLVGGLKAGCHVKQIALSSLWGAPNVYMDTPTEKNFSYGEIHMALAYGFELSWMDGACQDYWGDEYCYVGDNFELVCLPCSTMPEPDCDNHFGLDGCGWRSNLTSYVSDSIYGVLWGLCKLTHAQDTSLCTGWSSEYEVGMDIGYVVPYMGIRFLFGFTFLVVVLIYKCRRRHLSVYENIEAFLQHNNINPIRYSYRDIKSMTRSFKDKLGEGGYGSVYKGRLRSGPFAAIKMLSKAKANGQEFISEVATIGRIFHVNVVQLVGFCVEGSKRALVYEYMPNGSLDKYIFSKEGTIPLSYEKIYEIALGVARGIAYLHQGCDMQILHFDIKPHNILLDENFMPKVSDFGLAKLYPVDDNIVTLTAVRGTIGYMAPELFYKNIGGVSYKADVYSFGMLLMEMAGKRKNLNTHVEHSSQLYFPFWIYDQFNENKDIEMEDVTEEDKNIAKKMFIVALWCIQLKPFDRPSMSKVVEMLEGELENLELPPKPSLYPHEEIALEDLEADQAMTSDSSFSATPAEDIANESS